MGSFLNILGVPGATEKLWYALEASPQALRGNVLGFAFRPFFQQLWPVDLQSIWTSPVPSLYSCHQCQIDLALDLGPGL